MILYTIRHKDTGELMPLMKKGKGYSHWNPNNKEPNKLLNATKLPRLVGSLKTAQTIIGLWAALPNRCVTYIETHLGDDWSERCKPDGRKKSDLEIVKVELKFRN